MNRRGFFGAVAAAFCGLLGWRPAWYASRPSPDEDWNPLPSIHMQQLDGSCIGFAEFSGVPRHTSWPLLFIHENAIVEYYPHPSEVRPGDTIRIENIELVE